MGEEIDLGDLKKIIEEGVDKKKQEKTITEKKKTVESVEDIVDRVLEKYKKEGAYIKDDFTYPESIVEKFVKPTIRITGSPEDLSTYENPFIRAIGRIYLQLKDFFDEIQRRFFSEGFVKHLDWQLYSINMPFSGTQYIAIVSVLSVIAGVFGFFSGLFLAIRLGFVGLIYPFALAFGFSVFVAGIMLAVPSAIASNRARQIDRALPFALRHLAVEIRSGAGLYQALKAVGMANYGVLSNEINRTIKEIDEGSTTELALANLAARTKSKGLKRAAAQIIRALRLGGNLSAMIMSIASDVSFEQRMKVIEYSEKLNSFGVFYMFIAVVFPVMFALISSIGYAPSKANILSAFALPPNVIFVLYVVLFPSLLLLLMYYVRISDPMR